MNQSVHSCMRGCLTLKFSGSWKTVICSSADFVACDVPAACESVGCSSALPAESFPFAGEIGIVSSGTGDFGWTAVEGVSRDAILRKWANSRVNG